MHARTAFYMASHVNLSAVSKLRKYASLLDVLPSALEGKLRLASYASSSLGWLSLGH